MAVCRSHLHALTISALIAGLAACGGEEVVQGECQRAFDGEICTWGTMAGDNVTEFGATVPLTMVESAPMEGELVFPPPFAAVVPLPQEVTDQTGFDHLAINWELHGHPPALFLTPHFDFHFYTIAPERVRAIDCSDLTKPAALPSGYTLPDLEIPDIGMLVGACVPTMGMHGLLETELDQTEPFGASMVLGYYEQNLIFLEPMIAKAKLTAAESFMLNVPAVPNAGAGVRWPTHFEAVYDPQTRAYRFVFSGLPAG